MIKICLSRKLGELRLTQKDVSKLTGIRPATINEMYHEIVDRVSLDQLDKLCEVLGCDLEELLVRIPGEPQPIKRKERKKPR